ncbi:hypothetical protein PAEPH01_0094 [Pancytospora epiphaga]|nr:hypothetical protein PAEPH01_0094 [Pancytospora epiphaga]
MNRRDRKSVKLLEFEPKVPVNPPEEPKEQTEQPNKIHSNEVPIIKGTYAPVAFSTTPKFNPSNGNFILNLPDFLLDSSFVLFDDGSFGFKKEGTIYECDSSYMGNSMVVELDSAATKIGDVDFMVTGYQVSQNFQEV